MDKAERVKMLKCMEFIARHVNDEDVFAAWLYNGVADGDIKYSDTSARWDDEIERLEFYIEDNEFSDIMNVFLRVMYNAYRSGGLYCDGVIGPI